MIQGMIQCGEKSVLIDLEKSYSCKVFHLRVITKLSQIDEV